MTVLHEGEVKFCVIQEHFDVFKKRKARDRNNSI